MTVSWSRPDLRGVVLAAILVSILGCFAAGAAEAEAGEVEPWSSPVLVSPGAIDRASGVEARCPTFSWGPVPGAVRQELILVVVDRDSQTLDESTVLTSVDLPGTVGSWTPSIDQCLRPAGTYGWSVRSVGKHGASAWSETRLFRILTATETWSDAPVQRQKIDVSLGTDPTGTGSVAVLSRAEAAPFATTSGIFIEGLSVPAGQILSTVETECPAGALCYTGIYCGNGRVVLGGGPEILSTTGGLVLYGSYPDEYNPPPQTWWVKVLNTGGTPANFKSHAICTTLAGAP